MQLIQTTKINVTDSTVRELLHYLWSVRVKFGTGSLHLPHPTGEAGNRGKHVVCRFPKIMMTFSLRVLCWWSLPHPALDRLIPDGSTLWHRYITRITCVVSIKKFWPYTWLTAQMLDFWSSFPASLFKSKVKQLTSRRPRRKTLLSGSAQCNKCHS